MSETTPRTVGRSERNFLAEVVSAMFPRIAILGRDFIVGDLGSVDYWTTTVREILTAEWKVEEEIAKKARRSDADRGIPAWQTFRKANDLEARVKRFDREISEARNADETKRKEREAKEAAAEQPAATGTDGQPPR